MCVRKLKPFRLMADDMVDLLSEHISTASYRMNEQIRQSY